MTEKQKFILRGLADGKTQTQIAKEMGISRQAVNNALCAIMRIKRDPATIQYPHYPNLGAWMREQEMTASELSRQTGMNPASLTKMLNKGIAPCWDGICKLKRVTGMTADELMYDGEEAETDD